MNSETKENKLTALIKDRLQIVREFTDTTTLHGVPRLTKTKNRLELNITNFFENSF